MYLDLRYRSYPLTLKFMSTLQFKVTGMHCHSCKALIEDVCKDFPGVVDSEVNAQTGEAVVDYEGELDKAKLKSEIEALGEYKVTFKQ